MQAELSQSEDDVFIGKTITGRTPEQVLYRMREVGIELPRELSIYDISFKEVS